ncbi:MAG: hypothetical protein Q8Q26_05125, partial [Pseudorhodobacter sp.]|nr:hypothetical protein [Pseudorhodobacter sp.]
LQLLESGKVVIGAITAGVRRHGAVTDYELRCVYHFTEEAEAEWQDVLREVSAAHDYSEMD